MVVRFLSREAEGTGPVKLQQPANFWPGAKSSELVSIRQIRRSTDAYVKSLLLRRLFLFYKRGSGHGKNRDYTGTGRKSK
jgi:hypothetical protein